MHANVNHHQLTVRTHSGERGGGKRAICCCASSVTMMPIKNAMCGERGVGDAWRL